MDFVFIEMLKLCQPVSNAIGTNIHCLHLISNGKCFIAETKWHIIFFILLFTPETAVYSAERGKKTEEDKNRHLVYISPDSKCVWNKKYNHNVSWFSNNCKN